MGILVICAFTCNIAATRLLFFVHRATQTVTFSVCYSDFVSLVYDLRASVTKSERFVASIGFNVENSTLIEVLNITFQ